MSVDKKTKLKTEQRKVTLKRKENEKELTEEKKSFSGNKTTKVVVKRRKTDLKPTRASAVAIASQANRLKKQAFIEKMAAEKRYSWTNSVSKKESSKIPLWVWMFFGCSLFLFCVSFYQAIIRPNLEEENVIVEKKLVWTDSSKNLSNVVEENENDDEWDIQPINVGTAEWLINWFFTYLSNREFDEALDLMAPSLKNSSEITSHFGSFRMTPFLLWIEGWKLVPKNIKHVWVSNSWKDKYSFDISYTLSSSQVKYDEEREFIVSADWPELRLASLMCVTPKCSFHPIFWPENFDLMR